MASGRAPRAVIARCDGASILSGSVPDGARWCTLAAIAYCGAPGCRSIDGGAQEARLGQRRATVMTATARASGTPRRRAGGSVGSSLQAAGHAQPTGALAELQRLAGNRAVSGLVVQRFAIDDALQAVVMAGGAALTVVALGPSLLLADDREAVLLDGLIAAGFSDRDKLTNIVFWLRHPDRIGAKIEAGETALAKEWKTLRNTKVKKALRRAAGGGSDTSSGPMSAAKRASLIEKAKKQGASGDEKLKAQMEAAMPATGETAADGTPVRKTLDEWFADHEPDAKFLGLRIRASSGSVPGVHKEFLTQLELAETELRSKFPGKDDKAIRDALGIRDIGGLRRPKLATGGSQPSLHSFGMAIDINAATNPFVGNAEVSDDIKDAAKRAEIEANRSPRVIERAMLLIHGEAFDVETKLKVGKRKATAEESYDLHARASQALADYLKLADATDEELQPHVERAQAAGDTRDLAAWRERIANDKQLLPFFDFGKHPNPEEKGYLDLAKDLVLALTDKGGLTWGGTYNKAKDIMHFDYRGGSIQRAD